jgi:cytochrome c553
MKHFRFVVALACAVSMAGAADTPKKDPNYSGKYPELREWMRDMLKAEKVFEGTEKTGEKAVESGEDLEVAFEEMTGFWRQFSASDAVKISVEGKAASAQLVAAAHAGDAEKAAAAWQAVSATCHACHEKRREKLEDGSFRPKLN